MECLSTGLLLITTVVCVVTYVAHRMKNMSRSQLPLPPGPTPVETLKGVCRMMRTGRMAQVASEWADKYGDIVMQVIPVLGTKSLYLNNPADAKEFFTGKQRLQKVNHRFSNTTATAMTKNKSVTFSSSDTEGWIRLRKTFFTSLKFYGEGLQSTEQTMREEVQRVVDTLQQKQDQDVEVRPLIFNSVMNILYCLLTGRHLAAGSPFRQETVAFLQSVLAVLSPSFLLTAKFLPFMLHVPGSKVKTQLSTMLTYKNKILQHFYHEAKATLTPGTARGLVDAWIEKSLGEESSWMTEDHIQGLLIDILTGGTVTTSETLTSMLLLLLHHPEVICKIQAEVSRVVGPDDDPGIEHRGRCHYTEATVLETLRTISLVPVGVAHRVTEDTEYKGFCIPKGTGVFSNQWKFHRSETLWEDALQFRPERFLDEKGELLQATHPLRRQLLPFGVGMRACPGESFARARLFLYLSTLLKHFNLRPPEEGVLPPFTPGMESWSMGAFMIVKGYSCRFDKRSVR